MKFKILSAVCCMLGFVSSAFANEKIYVNQGSDNAHRHA